MEQDANVDSIQDEKWVPFGYENHAMFDDREIDLVIERLPCYGRGLTLPPMSEMDIPQAALEPRSYVVPEQVPVAKGLGRGRGKARSSSDTSPTSTPGRNLRLSEAISRTLLVDSDDAWSEHSKEPGDTLAGHECDLEPGTEDFGVSAPRPVTGSELAFNVRDFIPDSESASDAHIEADKPEQRSKKKQKRRNKHVATGIPASSLASGAPARTAASGEGSEVLVERIPRSFCLDDMYDMLAQFGSILEHSVTTAKNSHSVNVRYASIEAAEYAVQCLNHADVGAGDNSPSKKLSVCLL